MKKFLTLLCVLFTATYVFGGNNDSENSKKMLEKGKTWWYNIDKSGGGKVLEEQDYGITVGDEVEIDGETWHELNICKRSYLKDSEWKYSTDTVFVAYMKEADNKLYTLYDLEKTEKSINDNCGPQGWLYYVDYFDSDYPHSKLLIMDFSTKIGDSFKYGCDWYNTKLEVDGWGIVLNSGYNYNFIKLIKEQNYHFNYITGIGESSNRNHFFDPLSSGILGIVRYDVPHLRYVTDASGEIIYEGIGGRKVWEDFAGVESISVTTPDAEVKWYNLQGLQVAEQRTPGIYIRKQGRETRKVLIR